MSWFVVWIDVLNKKSVCLPEHENHLMSTFFQFYCWNVFPTVTLKEGRHPILVINGICLKNNISGFSYTVILYLEYAKCYLIPVLHILTLAHKAQADVICLLCFANEHGN